MYENIVIESYTNVFDNKEVQGVCVGAAHQMRMIKRALSERQTLVFFMFLFLFWCGPCGLWLLCPPSLSSYFSLIHVLHSVAGPPLPYLTTCTSSYPLTNLISLSRHSLTLRMKPKQAILRFQK